MKGISTKKTRLAGGYNRAKEMRSGCRLRLSAGYKLLPAHLPVVRSHILI